MLGDDRVDDLVVAVAETDCEHSRQAVDVAPPLVVREPDAVALDHDQRVGGERLHLVEIDHHVAGRRTQVDRLDAGLGGVRHGPQSVFVRPARQVMPRVECLDRRGQTAS